MSQQIFNEPKTKKVKLDKPRKRPSSTLSSSTTSSSLNSIPTTATTSYVLPQSLPKLELPPTTTLSSQATLSSSTTSSSLNSILTTATTSYALPQSLPKLELPPTTTLSSQATLLSQTKLSSSNELSSQPKLTSQLNNNNNIDLDDILQDYSLFYKPRQFFDCTTYMLKNKFIYNFAKPVKVKTVQYGGLLQNIHIDDIISLNNLLNEFNVSSIVTNQCFIKMSNPTNMLDASQQMYDNVDSIFNITAQVNGIKFNNKTNIWSPIWTIIHGTESI